MRTDAGILDAEGATAEIGPGMVAEVDLLAGSKTLPDYLTWPIIREKDRAMRD